MSYKGEPLYATAWGLTLLAVSAIGNPTRFTRMKGASRVDSLAAEPQPQRRKPIRVATLGYIINMVQSISGPTASSDLTLQSLEESTVFSARGTQKSRSARETPVRARTMIGRHSAAHQRSSPFAPSTSASEMYKGPFQPDAMDSCHTSHTLLVVAVVTAAIIVASAYLWPLRTTSRPRAHRLSASDRSTAASPVRDDVPRPNLLGLCQVYPPVDSEAETDVDIIAIHGLDTKSPDTWLWRDRKQPNKRAVNWLADLDMLPSTVGAARIFTCDWPADLFERSDMVQRTIGEFGLCLLSSIKARPPGRSRDGDSKPDERPIIFIASCLGGIILLEALSMAQGEHRFLVTATRGVVFLSTPFRGTSFQDVAAWAEPGLMAWALIRDKKVTKLLENVSPAFNLIALVQGFTALKQEQDIQVATFFERGYTNLYDKIGLLGRLFPRTKRKQVRYPFGRKGFSLTAADQLVDCASATLDIGQKPIGLSRRHVMMNKFEGPDDEDYRLVSGKIMQFLETVRTNTPIQSADRWIRDKHYNEERLRIQRLSGELLPMERCYINLAIVDTRAADSGKELDGEDSDDDAAPAASPFSLASRLKIESPKQRLQVDISTLFDPRPAPGGQTKEPRRILIRGRAGMGKSTLCKKMVYDFIYRGSKWNNLFARVLWMPLRKLKQAGRPSAEQNMGVLFHHIFFEQNPGGGGLAQTLWEALERDNRGNSLFILDGLDEVLELLDEGQASSETLYDILNSPNVIITTRPHINLPRGLNKPDLELETVGFYPDQVQKYLKAVVSNPSTLERIQTFLNLQPLVQGLVRIPIQLDALCFTWDGLEEFGVNSAPETMTTLYQAIVAQLWRKDLSRVDTALSESTVRDALRQEVERLAAPTREILEYMAFSGMFSNIVEFQPSHRGKVLERFPIQANGFDQALGHLSFMRGADTSAQVHNRYKSYHFLHLTFQEFFAAGYIARRWKAREDIEYVDLRVGGEESVARVSPIRFFQRHKYTSRYDIVWRFVAGLTAPAELSRFFDDLESPPLDLLGPAHQRLVMHCLSEVSPSTDFPIRSDLEGRLSQWLLFEVEMLGDSLLAGEIECPDRVRRVTLETDLEEFNHLKIPILRAMARSRASLSKETQDFLFTILRQPGIGNAAASALASQPRLSSATVTKLLGASDIDATADAVEALTLPFQPIVFQGAVAETVVAMLKDAERSSALSARLRHQHNISEPVILAVTRLSEDKDEKVREIAIDILGGQHRLPDVSFLVVLNAMADKNASDDLLAAAERALEHRRNASPAVLEALLALLRLSRFRNARIREKIVAMLSDQPELSDRPIQVIVEALKNDDPNDGRPIAKALARRALPQELVDAIVLLLESPDMDRRATAAVALRGSRLPRRALEPIVSLLADEAPGRRAAGLGVLLQQQSLSPDLIERAVAVLKNRDRPVLLDPAWGLLSGLSVKIITLLLGGRDRIVVLHTLLTLGSSSNLTEEVLQAVAPLLQSHNEGIRDMAAEVLRRHRHLPDPASVATLADLRVTDVTYGSGLLEKLLDGIGIPLAEQPEGTPRVDLQTERLLASLYGRWLNHSFQEQLSLYMEGADGQWFIVVDQVGGLCRMRLDADLATEARKVLLEIVREERSRQLRSRAIYSLRSSLGANQPLWHETSDHVGPETG